MMIVTRSRWEETLNRTPQRLFIALAALCVFALAVPAATPQESRAELQRITASKSLGLRSAPITIEVFSDYQCPSCREFYEDTLRPMIDDYVASGKVYLIHRDFPLPLHPYSREAARWANAAARIGKFEAVDRTLYDNQAAWDTNGNIAKFVAAALTPAEFRRVALLMRGCESDSHDELRGCVVDAAIQHDIAAGEMLPVRATPTYVISFHGQAYAPGTGAISWPILKQFLDGLLSSQK